MNLMKFESYDVVLCVYDLDVNYFTWSNILTKYVMY